MSSVYQTPTPCKGCGHKMICSGVCIVKSCPGGQFEAGKELNRRGD
jgi:radical SAM protein with 4Fe4S-binding SPASM domain